MRLTRAARSTIDLTAMYWVLLSDPEGDDEKGFTEEEFEKMGVGAGRLLYEALHEAATRGVHIRIFQAPGFSKNKSQPPPKQESDRLQDEFPDQISIHTMEITKWYGGSGIMHQKIWIFDERHLYIGSANMDWKSISQAKEMSVAWEDCPILAQDVGKYCEAWWTFSALPPSCIKVFDPVARIDRQVPPWSTLVPMNRRVKSPFSSEQFATKHNFNTPLQTNLNGESGGIFLTGSPKEMCGKGRNWDEEGLIYTIDDAQKSVYVSVMDFAPVSLYERNSAGQPLGGEGVIPGNTPVWWPSLFDSLLSAVLTRKVYVRLLVSKWAHTSGFIVPFLHSLQMAADAGRADKYMTAGQLEIKQFIIPGWDNTSGNYRQYPGHTRVNHTKNIATDQRINIGTSNMTWDYFTSTAGSSFNANHPALVRVLQSVFDRDWASSHAYHLTL